MIQIVAKRLFSGAEKAVFVFPPSGRLFSTGLKGIYTKFNEILDACPEAERFDLFYTVAHHTGAFEASQEDSPVKSPQRTHATFVYQTILAWDLDGSDTGRALEYTAVVAKVLRTSSESVITIVSGNGIHCIVNLKTWIRTQNYFTENREAYREICRTITAECLKLGLPLDPTSKQCDPSIFEPARVLRMPGTVNKKPGRADSQCRLLQYSDQLLEIDLFELSGLKARAAENVSPAEIRRQYPAPDFAEMAKECGFVRWTVEHPEEVHEPDYFTLISLLAPQAADSKATIGALEFTPKSLAEHVFKSASNSPSLKGADPQSKWEQAKQYGGRKCSTIGQTYGKCGECPHYQKIPTPLALKSKSHIASEALGYWVLGAKGQYLHPAYEDLAKVYQGESFYVVNEAGRLLAYENGVYKPMTEQRVKAWIEKKMIPSEPLRAAHREEFVSKVKSSEVLSPDEHDARFIQATNGKLNCQNGVLDIVTGKLLPHDPKFGFMYKLPYSVDLGAEAPEEFLTWLGVICQEKEELIDSLLDLMAYCLWPAYDDHLFAYFIGDGANGKSTLIHVMEAIVGVENRSTISIQQLAHNRFAPALLEGKLVNMSEESSGSENELGIEAMNTIKTLSAGGSLMAEHKGEKGFAFINRAKLIFSANRAPRFKESGHAISRRMLVIPFGHKITDPDSRVEQRLIEQVPAIVAMLIRRIQANLTRNGGRFIVERGGAEAEHAKVLMLVGTGTAYQWAQENISPAHALTEDDYIVVDDAYQNYREWCDSNGLAKPVSKHVFSRVICEHVLAHASGRKSKVKRIAGKTTRVYTHVKYKTLEEELVNEESKEKAEATG